MHFAPERVWSKTFNVANLNFCIKHVQGPTSRKQEVLVSVVDPWTCLLQKIPVVTWDVLLYTSSGAKCTYDTLAFSWRNVTNSNIQAGSKRRIHFSLLDNLNALDSSKQTTPNIHPLLTWMKKCTQWLHWRWFECIHGNGIISPLGDEDDA